MLLRDVWTQFLALFIVQPLLFVLSLTEALVRWTISWKPSKEVAQNAYKGTLPSPPKAIAVVWADDSAHEAVTQTLADVLSWCDQTNLEIFCIYDPSGALKNRAQDLQSHLPQERYSVQVGWSREQCKCRVRCSACRQQGVAQPELVSGLADSPPPSCHGPSCQQSADASAGEPCGPFPYGSACDRAAWFAADLSNGHPAHQAPNGPNGVAAGATHPEPALAKGPAASQGALSKSSVAASACEPCECPQQIINLKHGGSVVAAHGTSAIQACRRQGHCQPLAAPQRLRAGYCTGVLRPSGSDGEPCTGTGCEACALPQPQQSIEPNGLCSKAPYPVRTLAEAALMSAGLLSRGQTVGQPPPPQQQQQQAVPPDWALAGVRSPLQPKVGGKEPRPVAVRLLSTEDGYLPLLQAARTGGVCSGCGEDIPLKSGSYRDGMARLREEMAELAGPAVNVQPELVLVVGPVLTLAGYPPLQLAASEILHLGPGHGLTRARVDAAMAKYLRTEQRFGK